MKRTNIGASLHQEAMYVHTGALLYKGLESVTLLHTLGCAVYLFGSLNTRNQRRAVVFLALRERFSCT